MLDDLSLSFFGGKLWERQDCPQHLAYIGRGQGWQDFDFELLSQFRVALAFLGPIQLRVGDEPQCASGQCGMVLPGQVFLSLKLICPGFVFAILNHSLNEVATTQQLGQELQEASSGALLKA